MFEFLNLSFTDTLDLLILCWVVVQTVLYTIECIILHLYQLKISSTSTPSHGNQKCLQILPRILWDGGIASAENPLNDQIAFKLFLYICRSKNYHDSKASQLSLFPLAIVIKEELTCFSKWQVCIFNKVITLYLDKKYFFSKMHFSIFSSVSLCIFILIL